MEVVETLVQKFDSKDQNALQVNGAVPAETRLDRIEIHETANVMVSILFLASSFI